MSMKNTVRYLARFKVETASALTIGSGQTGLLNERLIVRDANALPYIPGTALAGIIRHTLSDGQSAASASFVDVVEEIWGYQKGDQGLGSRIHFSDAILIGPEGETILEGLQEVDMNHEYFKNLLYLPERDHVRINHKGAAKQHAKFEEQLVPRGVRFMFELELEGTSKDREIWMQIMAILRHPSFRVGAGTRRGFGALKVLECQEEMYDLSEKDQLKCYLDNSASLNSALLPNPQRDSENPQERSKSEAAMISGWRQYRLTIRPRDFFLFGAGVPEGRINMPPKKEAFFEWSNNSATLSEAYYLIPATSIKGALAHRLAFHWNKLEGQTIEGSETLSADLSSSGFDMTEALSELDIDLDIELMNYGFEASDWGNWAKQVEALTIDDSKHWKAFLEEMEERKNNKAAELYPVGEQNFAVRTIMGYAKNSNNEGEEETGARGRLLLSDVYLTAAQVSTKTFTHVAIDRFTGGGIDGALFQEEVITTDEDIELDLFLAEDLGVDPEDTETEQQLLRAFEATLDDLCAGRLPLGGNTMKGHGVFTGDIEKVKS